MILPDKNSQEQELTIRNTAGQTLRVILEPWAEELGIPVDATATFTGWGSNEHPQFTLEIGKDYLIIYASSGARLAVNMKGVILNTGSRVIPAL